MRKIMNSKITINYNKKKISLNYSSLEKDEKLLRLKLNKVVGSGEAKDYTKAEQEAQLYLVRNALDKSTRFHKLERIVGITQNVHLLDEGEIKIILEGYGVFN